MAIGFCPKCKNIPTPAPKKNSSTLICKSCNITIEKAPNETTIEPEKITNKKIGTGAAEKDFSGHEFKCTKCGNDKCKIIDIGMMFGDEDWVYLTKCTKCDYSERVGDWC